MSTLIRVAITITTLIVAGIVGVAGPASAHPAAGGPTGYTSQPPACTALSAKYFDVELDQSGAGNISVADDGVTNCDEAVVLWSLANSSAVIDDHEPIIDQLVLQVADLEAAGTKGIDFSIELDPCWAGFQVLRDGDTLVHQQMLGDGCEMTVGFSATPTSPDRPELAVVGGLGLYQGTRRPGGAVEAVVGVLEQDVVVHVVHGAVVGPVDA